MTNPDLPAKDPNKNEENKKFLKPKKVFVAEAAKDFMAKDVLKLLHQLGFETIPIDYKENYQKPLEHMFREYPDVSFAVVMLVGEDFSYPKDGKPGNAKLTASSKKVFMLGFLLAKLGKLNTFVLYFEQSQFLLPTDLLNAAYIAYNPQGDWRKILVNRLKDNGYEIDAADVLREQWL